MRSLILSTGMTSEEIVTLATEKNVNLYDPTLSIRDVTSRLGVGMVQTADEINQGLRDAATKSHCKLLEIDFVEAIPALRPTWITTQK